MTTIFLTGLLTSLALIVAIGAQSLFIMRQAIRRDHLMLALGVCLAGDIVLISAGTAGVGAIADRAPWVLHALTWAGVAYLVWFAVNSFRSAFARRRSEPGIPDAGPAGGAETGLAGASLSADGAGVEGSLVSGAGRTVDVGADGKVASRAEERLMVEPLEAGGDQRDRNGAAVATKPALDVRLRRDRSGGEDDAAERLAGQPAGETETPVGETETPVGKPVRPVDKRSRTLTPARVVVLTALSVSLLNPHAILDTVVMLGTLANSHGADKWVFATGALTGSALWFLTLGLGARALAPLLDTPRTWRIVDIVVGVVMLGIAAKLALG